MTALVFPDQDRSAEMTVPGKVKVWTISTRSPLMQRGAGSVLSLLQSRMSSFVFVVFRTRLLAEHHSVSLWTSFLETDSSPPVIKPTTVVSSANFKMVLLEVGG